MFDWIFKKNRELDEIDNKYSSDSDLVRWLSKTEQGVTGMNMILSSKRAYQTQNDLLRDKLKLNLNRFADWDLVNPLVTPLDYKW